MSVVATENRVSGNGALTPVQTPTKLLVQDDSPVAYIMDTARFEHCNRISKMMAACAFMPDHLVLDKNKNLLPEHRAVANCMLVLGQAMRWQMDPYNVAAETYVVSGKLSYQGKLIAAVVNARGKLANQLDVIYSNGKGDTLAAVVYGSKSAIPIEAKNHLKKYANEEDRDALTELKFLGVMAIRITVGQCKTNNQMWSKDPEQKLFYTGATKWARRFCPELMLGIITDDDLERMSHQGGSLPNEAFKPTEQLRTLEELSSKVAGVATVDVSKTDVDHETTVQEVKSPTAEPVKEPAASKVPEPTQEPTSDGEVPVWVTTWKNRIGMMPKFSPAASDFDALFREYRGSDEDKKGFYFDLFEAWLLKTIPFADKPSLVPLLHQKIDQIKQYVPETVYEGLKAKIVTAKK